MLIELRQCVFGYGKRAVVAAEHVQLAAGRALGVFGPNGCGKTTLVRGITGLLAPLRGTIQRTEGLRFGYLPQHRALATNWPMRGLDAAAMALSAQRRLGWLGGAAAELRPWLRLLDAEDLSPRPFGSLSGGQQQRLLLAGALAAGPQVLVLDEAVEGLDVGSRQAVLRAMRQAGAEGLCVVCVSHSVEDIVALADEVAWIHLADDDAQPNRIEVIGSAAFAGRLAAIHKAV